ncbi:glycosyltransferase [Bradyrhizobium sp. HKCCYLS20291]|uniref:glycosyltransferase n=1 Tax=Bradyrhizobium sp. HKCCYLS20291 TaxID=3420766 RepID=UPI003EBEC2CB
MKVLHVYKACLPETIGGIPLVIDQLATGLARRSVQVDLLALSPASGDLPDLQRNGYRIHRVPQSFEIASTGFSLAAPRRFQQLSRDADIVHFHYPWPFMDALHLALSKDRPSVVTYHSDIVRQKQLLRLYRPLARRFLTHTDRIVATSPNYLLTSEMLQAYVDKVSVIPIGLDPRSYPEPEAQAVRSWRERLGEGFVLFVGVLRAYKGLPFLIDAARLTGLPTVIVGAGPMEGRLRRLARGAPHVTFLGSLSEADKAAVLSLCGAVVLPSHLRSEAFGVALLEGALYGKPMISTEIGTGTSYVNIADLTGLVVPPADPRALAAAMRRLHDEPELATAMGQHARERCLAMFGADRMTDAHLDVYREVLAARSR